MWEEEAAKSVRVERKWLGKRLLKCSVSKKWGKVGIQLGGTKQDTHGIEFKFFPGTQGYQLSNSFCHGSYYSCCDRSMADILCMISLSVPILH